MTLSTDRGALHTGPYGGPIWNLPSRNTPRTRCAKCLEMLKEAAPKTTRVGVLVNPLNRVLSDAPICALLRL